MFDELICSLPKAELHIHLEGAIPYRLLLQLSEKYSSLELLEHVVSFQEKTNFHNYEGFLTRYQMCMQLIRSAEDFANVIYEHGRDMQAQNIRYSEMYISIYQHIHLWGKGLHVRDVFEGIAEGRKRAREDFGVEFQWILGIPRQRHFSGRKPRRFDDTIAKEVLKYAIQGQKYGVIGIGLGGNEIDAPPEPFKNVFHKAKEAGLHSIPHAGETEGASSVRGAIDALQADRICHGVRVVEDGDMLQRVVDSQLPLDICPTSNLALGLYPSIEDHPFYILDKAGAMLTINSDDPTIFGTTLCNEYRKIAKGFAYSEKDIVRFAKNSFKASFLPTHLKKRYNDEIDFLIGE